MPRPSDASAADAERHDPVTHLLPWGVSLLVHLGIVVLACFVIWSTVAPPQEEVIVPVAQLSRTPPARLQTSQTQRVQTQRTVRRSVTPAPQPSVLAEAPTPMPVVGLDAAALSRSSPFEAAEQPLATRFLGVEGGNARQVAFLIDASGSQVDTMDFVLVELKKTINRLSDQQTFTIVFYQGDDVIEVLEPGLKRADARTKRRAIEWLDQPGNVRTGYAGNPLKAIRHVLRYQPQVVFILSDDFTGKGPYEIDQQRLLDEIDRAVGSTRISAIQFLYPDPLASIPGRRGTLELIAERTGGHYKFLDESELGR